SHGEAEAITEPEAGLARSVQVIFLLDTDSLVFMMRGLRIQVAAATERQRRWQAVGNRIFNTAQARKRGEHRVGLSAVTVAELEFGARNSTDYAREIEATNKILSPFERYDFDAADCAFHYGNVRFELE